MNAQYVLEEDLCKEVFLRVNNPRTMYEFSQAVVDLIDWTQIPPAHPLSQIRPLLVRLQPSLYVREGLAGSTAVYTTFRSLIGTGGLLLIGMAIRSYLCYHDPDDYPSSWTMSTCHLLHGISKRMAVYYRMTQEGA